ncbi:MAG: hypothetical protein LBH34_03760 [Prevotellaceae bacterium]|jgi:sialate O-acetylesterase|nr:hypothetical protein [Prevotellaceae bacterium]
MLRSGFIGFILLLLYSCGQKEVSNAAFSVSPIFGENVVLQRNKANRIWGRGLSKTKVNIQFAGRSYQTKTDKSGDWVIETEELESGGPYSMLITCSKDTVLIERVWVGDVWLCSGQSNMEFSVGNFPWAKREVRETTNDQIFYYTLPNSIDLVPNKDIPLSLWRDAKGDNLLALSATAYFFAKNVQPEIGVPVGLIVSDWSGTAIEPWMDRESLRKFSQFSEVLVELDENKQSKEEVEQSFIEYRKKGWDSLHYLKGKGMEEKWYMPETDFSDWKNIEFPNYWEDADVGLDDFDGAVWFKTTFDLPKDFKGDKYQVFLNYVKDYNIAWVNGHKIGETYGGKSWSDYYVPIEFLKQKNNVLVVRVFNIEGKGGFNYHPLWESSILAGSWVFKVDYAIDSKTFPKPKIVNVNTFSYPTIIYNAMIAPLLNYSLTGFIWYQGESNEGRAYEYGELFPTLIDGWRKQFNQGNLPFYYVQLANYGIPPTLPENSEWAELREAQTYALQLPNTGMAIVIDIGEANDIHPKNKQEVGRRLALLALNKTYGKDVDAKAPMAKDIKFEDDRAIVSIESACNMRNISSGELINGFAIAGSDSVFYWADSVKVIGKMIIVSSSKVKEPVAVRYAWSKNPGKLGIYDMSGLPLAPFRSDSWRGITDDRVFNLNIVYF